MAGGSDKSAALILDTVEGNRDTYYCIHVHKAKGSAEMKIQNPLYILKLDRSQGVRLGLKLDVQVAMRCLFIKEVVGGLAMEHNKKGTEFKVRPGDRIIRVNKVENDAQAMLEECTKCAPMELELHRGSAVPIVVGLSATVKTAFGPFDEGMDGCVRKVDEEGDALVKMQGRVQQWLSKTDYEHFAFEESDRYYLKCYTDLKEFYYALKPKVDARASKIRSLEAFPPEETFGFRRHLAAFGMSNFVQDRLEGLQKCLDSILSQVERLDDEPLLAEFFGQAALPNVGVKQAEGLREKLDVLVEKHQAEALPP